MEATQLAVRPSFLKAHVRNVACVPEYKFFLRIIVNKKTTFLLRPLTYKRMAIRAQLRNFWNTTKWQQI